jgi:hypothetical protein
MVCDSGAGRRYYDVHHKGLGLLVDRTLGTVTTLSLTWKSMIRVIMIIKELDSLNYLNYHESPWYKYAMLFP